MDWTARLILCSYLISLHREISAGAKKRKDLETIVEVCGFLHSLQYACSKIEVLKIFHIMLFILIFSIFMIKLDRIFTPTLISERSLKRKSESWPAVLKENIRVIHTCRIGFCACAYSLRIIVLSWPSKYGCSALVCELR